MSNRVKYTTPGPGSSTGAFNCKYMFKKKKKETHMAFITYKIFDNGSDVAKCMERRADAITLGEKFYPSDLL